MIVMDRETLSPASNGWTPANGAATLSSSWETHPDTGLLKVFATAG